MASRDGRWRLALLCLLLLLLGLMIPTLVVTVQNRDAESAETEPTETYDYVIVGGGAAGCRMAEKLSANGSFSVLLLEAGIRADTDAPIEDIGPVTSTLETDYYNEYFWQCAQVPGPNHAFELDQQLTTGRLLGGGSSINGVQFVRGSDWTYERWVNLTGDAIWSVPNVLAAFKRIETYTATMGSYDVARRGAAGRLAVLETMITAPQTAPTSMAEKLTQAYAQMLGLAPLDDYNNLTAATRVGPFTSWQLHVHADGTRSSSSTAFLSPDVMARRNLRVLLAATVTKIRFDGTRTARSVDYVLNGQCRSAQARRRIILSAGVYSPVLLQHSGIGNASYLASIGVSPIVYDNPNVGRVMINQQVAIALFQKNVSDAPSANPADIYEGGAFLSMPANLTFNATTVSPRSFQIIGINAGPAMVLAVINLQPQSHGYVRIRDADPLRIPASNDGIFAPTPEGTFDVTAYTQAMLQYVCALSNEFQGLGVGPVIDTSYQLLQPSPAQCANATLMDQFVLDTVIGHSHHWTSSCKMGKPGDGISVTTSKGAVLGVSGLIIADDSILPIINDGNTVAPAFLVAEIIGDQILLGNV